MRPDGGISFPLVGDILAAGLIPSELQATITEALEAYIPDAVVTVSVTELRGLRVYVTGQVRAPGQFLVGRYIDALQAITLAGGLTAFANANDIRIMRRGDNGQIKVMNFQYNQIEKGQKLEQNIILQTNDVIVVP